MTRPISSVGSVALLVLLSFVDARVSCAAATPQENRDERAARQPPVHSRPAAYPASRQIAFPRNGHLYQRIDVPMGEQKLGGVTYQVTDALIQRGAPPISRTILSHSATSPRPAVSVSARNMRAR